MTFGLKNRKCLRFFPYLVTIRLSTKGHARVIYVNSWFVEVLFVILDQMIKRLAGNKTSAVLVSLS